MTGIDSTWQVVVRSTDNEPTNIGEISVKFDFMLLPDGISLPVLPIKLRRQQGAQTIDQRALVDTGSDNCIFHGDIGRMIGIDDIGTGDPTRIWAIKGGPPMVGYIHNIQINIGGYWFDAPALFSDESTKDPILGRKGFFDRFVVTFNYPKRIVELKPIP